MLPDSIAGRSLLVLLIGLTISHLLSTAVYSTDRQTAVLEANERQFADRVASVARLLEQADPPRRQDLVEVLNSPILTISWTPNPTFPQDHVESHELDSVRRALANHFGPLDKDRIHVIDRGAGELFSVQGPQRSFLDWVGLGRFVPEIQDNQIIQVSLQLGDGSWANFGLTLIRSTSFWSPRAILSTLIMILGIALFSALATRWVGRPLATFAAAADRLGRDVTAPPLPPGGPREVRQAIDAFNEMQSRIRRFVEDRTRMLAAISHDLRSPITRLKLRAELLPDVGVRTKMMRDLDEMEAMVSSTLDFAKGEERAEAIETIDLAATLESICDDAADMGLDAEYHWTGRLICTGRPLAMKRALANLIENGARYGGTVRVQAERRSSDVRIRIEDDGPGIPEASFEKIFTPFFRLEQSRNRKTGGIGLGLTVARTIIRAHGGDITLANRPEGGLRVEVTLPQGPTGI
ncbi:MAG: HAMP domain-containing protein [Rhodospirillales bacterium]|nr:HAMP domain-containing protein [Rhodospirillales bacterium]